jgi:hypothetical protein
MRYRKTTDSEGLFGKMSPDAFPTKPTRSAVSWEQLSAMMVPYTLVTNPDAVAVQIHGDGSGLASELNSLTTTANPLANSSKPPKGITGPNGRTQVWLPDHGHGPLGGFSTVNISASPNGAVACSLSSILETGRIPQRFFLSQEAKSGVLKRAERRGKKLPERLQAALQAGAG